MATVTITRPRSKTLRRGVPSAAGAHPKAVIQIEDGRTFTIPYAPAGLELAGIAPMFSQLARPGRKPLQARDATNLRTMPLDLVLTRLDRQAPVEDLIDAVTAIAQSGNRITLANLSPRERGPWRIIDAALVVTARQHGTNLATRAIYSLTLEEASDVGGRGPLTGGKGKPHKGITKARRYTIAKGDTLRKLAARFYGEPGEWHRIARRNKIKDPDRLKVGRTITIPADDDD